MQIKTFTASSQKKLDRMVNDFLSRTDIEIGKVHFSSNAFGAWVLVEYSPAK